jgi:hypothetical protein
MSWGRLRFVAKALEIGLEPFPPLLKMGLIDLLELSLIG